MLFSVTRKPPGHIHPIKHPSALQYHPTYFPEKNNTNVQSNGKFSHIRSNRRIRPPHARQMVCGTPGEARDRRVKPLPYSSPLLSHFCYHGMADALIPIPRRDDSRACIRHSGNLACRTGRPPKLLHPPDKVRPLHRSAWLPCNVPDAVDGTGGIHHRIHMVTPEWADARFDTKTAIDGYCCWLPHSSEGIPTMTGEMMWFKIAV